MKRPLLIKAFLALLFCALLPFIAGNPIAALAGTTESITFADSNLYTRICSELSSKIDSSDSATNTITISQENLANVTSPNLRAASISDTSGLEKFTQLRELDLCQNVVSSLSTISQLTNLETLNLFGNGLGDLAGLEKLTNLTTLKLGYNNDSNKRNSGNGINNLSALSSLTKLKNLDFSYNWTPDIGTYIGNLTSLETLDISQNMISGTKTTDITSLSNLTNLKSVSLYYNGIMDISPLYSLENLEKVMLQRNNLRNISGMLDGGEIRWKNLKELNISNPTYKSFASMNQATLQTLKTLAQAGQLNLIYEKAFETTNLPHIDANGKRFVTYDDFGAQADGIYDDYAAIRAAHTFANEYTESNGVMCEVRATAGKIYHIFKFYDDPVTARTSADWQGATFIVHDEYVEEAISKYRPILKFDNSSDITKLATLDFTINKNTKSIKGLSAELDATIASLNTKGNLGYHCAAFNSEKKQFMRSGKAKGKDQQDYFNVDRNGKVLNDIQWDFEKLTSFTLTPIQPEPLEVKNGNFITNSLETECELGKTTLTGTWGQLLP